jgi:exosortase C (VPDSG-CTERM-specific)
MKLKYFYLATAGLILLFSLPLWRLAAFAGGDELFSYILLMPAVSLYLVWLNRKTLPAVGAPDLQTAALFLTPALACLVWYWRQPPALPVNALALTTVAFWFSLVGVVAIFLGRRWLRALAFPLGLLIFLVPFPQAVRDAIEAFLQRGSAEVADWMFQLSGMTYFRTNLVFKLPTITLQVAPECSGIHSTVVLFITSLVAGQMLLKRPWHRAVLTLFVLPLAVVRNAFRILVLGELCVHVGPHMIDSTIHHRGGPLFFALSLVPFFALLYGLKRSEWKAGNGVPKHEK